MPPPPPSASPDAVSQAPTKVGSEARAPLRELPNAATSDQAGQGRRDSLSRRRLPPPCTPPGTLSGRAGTAPGGSEAGHATVLQELGVARRCGPSEGLLAPSPPPTPAGCRGGAQRQPSLPGPRSGKRGRQHTSVRVLAPDSRLSTQTRAWGLNPRIGGLQSGPGGAEPRAQAVEPMGPCQLPLGKPERLCRSFTPNTRRLSRPLLCRLMVTMH